MGIPEEYEFADEFVVQEPVAVVSADKMSVFYIGLDNPLSVSVPGVPPDKISVKITGPATFTQKGGGKYEIKPTGTGTVKVSVYSTVDKGEKLMGERTFRLLPVPEPMIVVGGKTAGQNISITDLQNARVDAILKDFLFDGVRFTVTRFRSIGKYWRINPKRTGIGKHHGRTRPKLNCQAWRQTDADYRKHLCERP